MSILIQPPIANFLGIIHGLEPNEPLAEIPTAGQAVDAATGLMNFFQTRLAHKPEWGPAESSLRELGGIVRQREASPPKMTLFLHEKGKKQLLDSLRSLGLLPPKGQPKESAEELTLRFEGITYLRDARRAIDALAVLQSLQTIDADFLESFRAASFAVVEAAVYAVPAFRNFPSVRAALESLFAARTRGSAMKAGLQLQLAGLLPQKEEAPDQAWCRLRETAAFFRNATDVSAATEVDLPFLTAVSNIIQFKGEAVPDSAFVDVNRRLARLTAAWEKADVQKAESERQAEELKGLLRGHGLLPNQDQALWRFWEILETNCLEHGPTLERSPFSETIPPPSSDKESPLVRETVETVEDIGARGSRYLPYPAQTKAGWLLFKTDGDTPHRARPYMYRIAKKAAMEKRTGVTACAAASYRERLGGPSATPTEVIVEFWESEKAFRKTLHLYQERLRGIESVSRILNTGYGIGEEGQPVPFSVVQDNAPSLRRLSAVYFHGDVPGLEWNMKRALAVGIKILSALQSLHSKDVIHQSLTPERIHLAPGSFDAYRRDLWVDGFENAAVTGQLNSSEGTPGYSCRDILEVSQHAAAPAIDLFSFAAVFHEILTSEVPFLPRGVSLRDGRDASDLNRLILRQMSSPSALPSLREINPGIPEDLDRLVRKLLQNGYAPEARQWTVPSVLDELVLWWEK